MIMIISRANYNWADLYLRGNTTTAKILLCGKTPTRIYKPRGKTSARIYKPRGFTPTAEKQRRVLAFTPCQTVQKMAISSQKMHIARKMGKKSGFFGCLAVDPPVNLKI